MTVFVVYTIAPQTGVCRTGRSRVGDRAVLWAHGVHDLLQFFLSDSEEIPCKKRKQ